MDKGIIVTFLIVTALLGLIPAVIAMNKGRRFLVWWIYGAAIFIVALLHIIMIDVVENALEKYLQTQDMKKCPYCDETIKGEAKVCRHCHRELYPDRNSIEQPPSPGRAAVPVNVPFDEFLGEYELAEGSICKVMQEGGQIVFQMDNGAKAKLLPKTSNTFAIENGGGYCTFVRANGVVSHLTLRKGGKEFVAKRLSSQ